MTVSSRAPRWRTPPRELLAQPVVQVLPDPPLLGGADVQDLLLHPPPLRNVTDNARKHPTVAEPELAHGQIHGERRTVLATTDHLTADPDDFGPARPEIVG